MRAAAMIGAHEIRRNAAVKFDCTVSEIHFGECLRWSWQIVKGAERMDAERAKQIMGWVAFQGIKVVKADERVSQQVAKILNLAAEAQAFLLANRGPEAFNGNQAYQALLKLEVPDDLKRGMHYAAAQKMARQHPPHKPSRAAKPGRKRPQ